MNLKELSLVAIDALIEFWATDTAKSVAESREESAAVIEAVLAQHLHDMVDRDYLIEKLANQRRELGAQHDDTIAELKRVQQVAKEMIDDLERRLGLAREAAAALAIPFEGLLLDGESRKWIAPEIWTAMTKGVTKARAVVLGAPIESPVLAHITALEQKFTEDEDVLYAFRLLRERIGAPSSADERKPHSIMTHDESEIDKLEGRELEAAVAERVMGWRWLWWNVAQPSGEPVRGLFAPDYTNPYHYLPWTPEAGAFRVTVMHLLPRYSDNIAAAFQVEDRIEELGLKTPYIQALAVECGVTLLANVKEYWLMLRATPEQRCRAALKAEGGVGE